MNLEEIKEYCGELLPGCRKMRENITMIKIYLDTPKGMKEVDFTNWLNFERFVDGQEDYDKKRSERLWVYACPFFKDINEAVDRLAQGIVSYNE